MEPKEELFEWRNLFTMPDFLFIIIEVLLLSTPYVIKHVPMLEKLEKVPPILLYVYRKDKFYFMTSPILLIAGEAYLLGLLIRWFR